MTTIYTIVEWTDHYKKNSCQIRDSYIALDDAKNALLGAVESYLKDVKDGWDFGDDAGDNEGDNEDEAEKRFKSLIWWNEDKTVFQFGDDHIHFIEIQENKLHTRE